jgi:hypothetical protein
LSDQKNELKLRAQAKIKEFNTKIANFKVGVQTSSNEEESTAFRRCYSKNRR